MKVAINARLFLPGRLEGVGWFSWEVVRRLVEKHPDWDFIFLFDRPFDPSFVTAPNIRPLAVPPPARHPLLWYLWFQVALPRVFRREMPDVFFSADGHCTLAGRVPTVMVTHDIAHAHFPEQVPRAARLYYDFFVPRFLRRADRLITVSRFSRDDLQRYYGIAPGQVAICGNGARPGFRPLSDSEKEAVRRAYAGGQEYFFYLGSVNPRKNVPRLIRAFDRFRAETGAPLRLLIGGRFGWLTGEVKEAYERAACRGDIMFLDYIPEPQLPQLLGASLALTYVSLFEGFGMPVLEAFHAEVPVLTSNTSSLPEVAGDAALLVDPADEAQIAQGMARLWREPDLRKRLVEAGRAQRASFNWERTASVVEEALISVSRCHQTTA